MNIMQFVLLIGKALMDLGTKLYEAFNKEIDISWLSKILKTFGVSADLPETMGLSVILLSVSAGALVGLIIYNTFK